MELSALGGYLTPTHAITAAMIAFCYIFSGLMSAAQAAFSNLDRKDLKRRELLGERDAKIVLKVVENRWIVFASAVFLNMLVNSWAASLMVLITGFDISIIDLFYTLALACLSALLLTATSELYPQAFAIRNAERVTLWVRWLRPLSYLRPLTWVVSPMAYHLRKLFGDGHDKPLMEAHLPGILECEARRSDSSISDLDCLLAKGAVELDDRGRELSTEFHPDSIITLPLWEDAPENFVNAHGFRFVHGLVKLPKMFSDEWKQLIRKIRESGLTWVAIKHIDEDGNEYLNSILNSNALCAMLLDHTLNIRSLDLDEVYERFGRPVVTYDAHADLANPLSELVEYLQVRLKSGDRSMTVHQENMIVFCNGTWSFVTLAGLFNAIIGGEMMVTE